MTAVRMEHGQLPTKIYPSVADPWHFGVYPDPRIHAFDLWIRIRIRIFLFSSLTFKRPAKN